MIYIIKYWSAFCSCAWSCVRACVGDILRGAVNPQLLHNRVLRTKKWDIPPLSGIGQEQDERLPEPQMLSLYDQKKEKRNGEPRLKYTVVMWELSGHFDMYWKNTLITNHWLVVKDATVHGTCSQSEHIVEFFWWNLTFETLNEVQPRRK